MRWSRRWPLRHCTFGCGARSLPTDCRHRSRWTSYASGRRDSTSTAGTRPCRGPTRCSSTYATNTKGTCTASIRNRRRRRRKRKTKRRRNMEKEEKEHEEEEEEEER